MLRNKIFTVVTAALLSSSSAFAVDNVGSCGWGSKLFDGDKGPAPQVLAVTTNGFLGNQTFAISSATSGCTRDGVVHSNWHSVMFIEGNKTRLAQDASRGQGETLKAVASLYGIPAEQEAYFGSVVQDHFAQIFPSETVTAGQVDKSISEVLANNAILSGYAPKA